MDTAVAVDRREITIDWLESEGACGDQVELFRATFGASVAINRANATRAVRAGLDLHWLAEQILPAPARRAYEEAVAPARRAYEEAGAPARRAYEEARATALCDVLGLE